jgi:co-chaperonin GroES (HSP10)
MTVTKLKTRTLNKSGIYPAGNRVLVKPDEIDEEITDWGLVLPKDTQEKYQTAVASGVVIAIGPDAFKHVTEQILHIHDAGRKELIEERVRGYSEPFALPGDRIGFAKYQGKKYPGKDGKRYLIINDEDITCRLDPEIEMTDLDTRKPAGRQEPRS